MSLNLLKNDVLIQFPNVSICFLFLIKGKACSYSSILSPLEYSPYQLNPSSKIQPIYNGISKQNHCQISKENTLFFFITTLFPDYL